MSTKVNVHQSQSGGVGFVGLLTILFIALKLLGKINWTWPWVLAPLWISAAVSVVIVIVLLLLLLLERD